MKHKKYQQNWYQNQNENSQFQNVLGVMLKKQTSFSLFLGSSTPITKLTPIQCCKSFDPSLEDFESVF
jgi:hypothetical protein